MKQWFPDHGPVIPQPLNTRPSTMRHALCLFYICCLTLRGLPRRFSSKESASQCRRLKRYGFDLWVQSLSQGGPWGRKWQSTPVFLSGKFHGRRTQMSYSPWSHKESNMSECTHTHINILLQLLHMLSIHPCIPLLTYQSTLFFDVFQSK